MIDRHGIKTRKRLAVDWLSEPLYDFGGGKNVLRVGDAVEGTQVFGGSGSGKTSGPGRALAVAMLRKGFGGLVLTAKSDELETWLGYFREAARDPAFDPAYHGDPGAYDGRTTGKLIVVGPGTNYRFNPLACEYGLGTANTGATASSRLVNLFMAALGSSEGRTDAYWTDALRELIAHTIDVIRFATGSVRDGVFQSPREAPSLQEMQDVIRTAAQSAREARSNLWQRSGGLCPEYLRAAYVQYEQLAGSREASAVETRGDMQDTFKYWLRSFAGLAEKTRSVVVSSFTAKASGLLRAPLRSLLCGEGQDACHADATPEATFEGKVVLINLPVKDFGEGAFAQRLIKTVWQHTTESAVRRVDGPCLPVFLWADESQFFVTTEDVLFQTTARSKLAATVYLTQNLPNYQTQLGGPGTAATDALLGALNTKIFCCNGDPQTNEWAERLFGQHESDEPQKTENVSHVGSNGTTSTTRVYRRIPYVSSCDFSELHPGGRPTGRVEAYIFKAGKSWPRWPHHDEQLPRKLITQGIAGRGIKHLFLQQGDRAAPAEQGGGR